MRRDADSIVALTLRIGAYSAFALLLAGLIGQRYGAMSVAKTGLLVLMATPVLRIGVALLLFLRERDWRYVWISAGVLAIVLASSWFGVTH
jgi:uncharacterized membrane protein